LIRNAKQLARTIDYTLLAPDARRSDIDRLCREALEYGFYSVCIQPRWVPFAVERLNSSDVKVVSVVGFPFGTELTKIKAAQARELIYAGVDEIDMVVDLAAVIDGDEQYLRNEIVDVQSLCRKMKPHVILKLIIESAALTTDQKKDICVLASNLGVDFVKTSTGYHRAGGATVEDVRLMKEFAMRCRVKAAGGIKTAQQALALLEAGAERLGCSAAVEIINEFVNQAQ